MDNPYVHGLRQYDNRPRSPVVVPRDMSALRKKILFENTLLEERVLHEHSANATGGYDAGAINVNPVQSYEVNSDNENLTLPGNADQFNFTINQAVTSFNLQIVGFGTFSLLNNYDENNFANCYLSAYNLNNIIITYNPVYVTASETLSSNGQYFTIFYTNTGSVLLTIFKSDTIEPAPSPTPSMTPTVTPTITPTVTPTRTPTPTVTPSASAPAGIPVASTASVTVAGFTGGNTSLNGAYTKKTSFGGDPSITTPPTTGEFYGKGYYQLIPPNVGIGGENDWYDGPTPYFEGAQGIWRIVALIDNNEGETIIANKATNSSNNNDYIPTAGWSPSITITAAPTFPDTATTNVVNALINTSDATTTSYLQSVGFTAVGGVFSIPLTKQVPPSQNYMSVEYKTTFNDGATCYLIHSTAANNKWFFVMEKFAYYDEEYGNQYSSPINIYSNTGQSSATILATRSSYSGTNINSMVSPNCFS